MNEATREQLKAAIVAAGGTVDDDGMVRGMPYRGYEIRCHIDSLRWFSPGPLDVAADMRDE